MLGIGMPEIAGFVMMFGLGGGIPLGLPPEKEDPALAAMAPAECLAYFSWAGMAVADPKSANSTERMIAEPEIQRFFAEAEKMIDRAIAHKEGEQADIMAAAMPIAKTLLTRPVAAFAYELKPDDRNQPIKIGLAVNLGTQAPQFKAALRKLLDAAPFEKTKVDLGGGAYIRFRPEPEAPEITIGFEDAYFIAGIGPGVVEGIRERKSGPPPAWYTTARKQLSVPRFSSLAYIDVITARDAAVAAMKPGDRDEVEKFLRISGLNGATSWINVGGLDDTGYVSRSLLAFKGPLEGAMKFADAPPLTAAELDAIPGDAWFATSLRFNAMGMLDLVKEVSDAVEPGTSQKIEQSIADAEAGLALSFRDDVFAALGDSVTLYTTSGGGGLLGGWTLAWPIRDRAKLEQLLARLEKIASPDGLDGEPGMGPELRKHELAGKTVSVLHLPVGEFSLAPSWHVTDKHLIVGVFPQAINAYVTNPAAAKSLAKSPELAPIFSAEHGPLSVTYVDMRAGLEALYSFVPLAMGFARAQMQREGIDFDPSIIPSAGAVGRHLKPAVTAIRRTPAGLEFVQHQTLPGSSLGAIGSAGPAPVMVALLLPAVQAAREAARRAASMNNLKQQAIAAHNFHDTMRHFPAQFNTDKDGKPLLSWRVHLLPFLEQSNLYDQFKLDEPWDSEHNKPLIEKMPAVFVSPGHEGPPGHTHYQAIQGVKGIFGPPEGKHPSNQGSRMADITDGTSNTIMIIEAKSTVVWTKPDDATFDPATAADELLGLRAGGITSAAFGDGSCRALSQFIDIAAFKALLTRSGGEAIGADGESLGEAPNETIESIPERSPEVPPGLDAVVPEPGAPGLPPRAIRPRPAPQPEEVK